METVAHTSSPSKLEANFCEVGTATEFFFCCFCFVFLPRSTAVNPAPPTQPRSSHSQASLLLATGRRAAGGREPPASLRSSSNSFNKLLLLLNEQRAIVVLSWGEQPVFPACSVNVQVFCSSIESSSRQQCDPSCGRTAAVFDQTFRFFTATCRRK